MLPPPDLTGLATPMPDAPYDENADGDALLRDAMFTARGQEKRAVIVFGANWCPDARALAGIMAAPAMAEFLEAHAVPVLIDVGRYERNQQTAKALNVHPLEGLPAVAILEPDGAVVDPASLYRWRSARAEAPQNIADWFAERLSPEFAGDQAYQPGERS